jgi:hypothetical protein
MKKFLFIFVFIIALLSVNKGFGQLSVSYQYSSMNEIGLGYSFSPKIWTELRIYSNNNLKSLSPELVFLLNIKKKEQHDIYIGIGGIANVFEGLVLPIGLQFRPIENFKRFSIQIEFEPILDISRDDLIFKSSAGIRYTFGKD